MTSPAPARFHLVDDPLFEQHRSRGYHPERPERLGAARRAIERCAAEGLEPGLLPPRDATRAELSFAHDPSYLAALDRLSGHHAALDADTYLAPVSVKAAHRAAGGTLALVDALLDADPSSPRTGVALLRPPGHHATRDRGMGFCLLNNAAVGAYHALERGLSRVAIVDWDVHHGNGTQDIFWTDPRVLYASLHQAPFYPGTGGRDEVGEGPGEGFTLNVPLSEGATSAAFHQAFTRVIVPALRAFAPELVIISAGFDAHTRDPLASMLVDEQAFGSMAASLAGVARESAGGRVALILEGGYDLSAVELSLAASLRGLFALAPEDLPGEPSPQHQAEIEAARAVAARSFRL
jgi:acetoin utilization deacetylase AcuC-like enzyme